MIHLSHRLVPGALLVIGVFVLSGAQVQCDSAEARPSLADLQAQIDELFAEADTAPVVIDGTGKILGPVIGGVASLALTQIDLPGVPLFLLQVGNDDFPVPPGTAELESTDCTGQAWLESIDVSGGVWGKVVHTTDVQVKTGSSTSPTLPTVRRRSSFVRRIPSAAIANQKLAQQTRDSGQLL